MAEGKADALAWDINHSKEASEVRDKFRVRFRFRVRLGLLWVRTNHEKTRQVKTRQDKVRQGKADVLRQGKAWQGIEGGREGKKGEIDWSTQLREDFVPARDTPEIHN